MTNKIIFFLSDYNWEAGELISEGPKRYKIRSLLNNYTQYVVKEKCAFPNESVCVVWETWRGANGCGGYRVEKVAYPEQRVPAQSVARQSYGTGRIDEHGPPSLKIEDN